MVNKAVQHSRTLVSRISRANGASRETLHTPEKDAGTTLANLFSILCKKGAV
jgi:hypothetical protein